MKQEEIDKAFEGRWRMKAKDNVELIPIALPVDIKELCRDFFEAGILLSQPPGHTMMTVAEAAEKFAKQDFEYWWDIYDKKRGKEKCMKKWEKLSVNERKACISATPAYVTSTPDKAYRKDPLTYLNGKCWNDEIITKNGTDEPTPDKLGKLASILVG
jgi:hypothetical protein